MFRLCFGLQKSRSGSRAASPAPKPCSRSASPLPEPARQRPSSGRPSDGARLLDGAARSSSDGAADGLSVQGERSRATPSMTTAQPAATARAASAAVHKVPTARPVNRQPGQRGGSAQQQNCVADTLNQVTLSLQPQPGAAEMSAGCTQKKQSRKQQDITTARQCTDITTAIQYTASTASTAPPRAHSSRAHSSSGFRLEEGSMSRSLASSMSSTVSRIPVRSAAAAGTLSLVA